MSFLVLLIGLCFVLTALITNNGNPVSFFDCFFYGGLLTIVNVVYHKLMVQDAEQARRRPRLAVDEDNRVDLTLLPPLQQTTPTEAPVTPMNQLAREEVT